MEPFLSSIALAAALAAKQTKCILLGLMSLVLRQLLVNRALKTVL